MDVVDNWRQQASSISIDEADARAGIGEAVAHPPPSATVPIEVHLGDEEPATGIDLLDVGDVARATRALDARLEDDCRSGAWRTPDPIAARRRARRPVARVAHAAQVLILPLVLRPPGALAKRPPVVAIRWAIHLEGWMARDVHIGPSRRPGTHWRGRYTRIRGGR